MLRATAQHLKKPVQLGTPKRIRAFTPRAAAAPMAPPNQAQDIIKKFNHGYEEVG